MTRRRRAEPDVRYVVSTFTTSIASCPSNVRLLHVWAPIRPAEHGIYTMDPIETAPVAFSVVKLMHSYRRIAQPEDLETPTRSPRVPPTHEAHLAAGWDYVNTWEEVEHWIASHDYIVGEDSIDCAAAETVPITDEDSMSMLVEETMALVLHNAEMTLANINKDQIDAN